MKMQSSIYKIIHNLQFLILSYLVCHKVTIAFHISIKILFLTFFWIKEDNTKVIIETSIIKRQTLSLLLQQCI
jgi:hypothetical protein